MAPGSLARLSMFACIYASQATRSAPSRRHVLHACMYASKAIKKSAICLLNYMRSMFIRW